MAQLLLISSKSLSTKDNREVGDVVGVFDDDHVFSEHERDIFDVVQLRDISRVAASVLGQVETRPVWRSKTTEWTQELPESAEVWKDGEDWKQVADRPRFTTRYEDGTIVENYSRATANHTVLISEKDIP